MGGVRVGSAKQGQPSRVSQAGSAKQGQLSRVSRAGSATDQSGGVRLLLAGLDFSSFLLLHNAFLGSTTDITDRQGNIIDSIAIYLNVKRKDLETFFSGTSVTFWRAFKFKGYI